MGETYTKKTYGHCKCSPLDVIVRFENSNLSSFVWGHRYTFLNDTEKTCNIFRCANCKKIIHDNFVVEKQRENHFKELSKWILENKRSVFEDADISTESKRKILNELGYSSLDY